MKGVDKLSVAQDKLTESHQLLPATLLEPLVEPKLRAFPTGRKRAMTGREATEQQERDQARVLGKQLSASSRRPPSQCGQPFSMPLESLHAALYKCALLDFTGEP